MIKLLFKLFILLIITPSAISQNQKVWIDADSGNEVDDIYAIIRLIEESDISVVGLSSAHFNNPDLLVFDKWNQYPTENISTIDISQQINQDMVSSLKRDDIICCKGADRQIGRAWGGFEPRDSEAVKQLTDYIKSMPEGEMLDIICLGAATNIASAIILHPEIKQKIRCYMLAAQYDQEKGIWNKNEFNVRNDLNAFDFLMSEKDINLYVMPITTCQSFKFKKEDTFNRLDKSNIKHKMLIDRWEETESTSYERILWDLALAEAYLCPDFCKLELRNVPQENGEHKIHVYISMDADKMIEDFWGFIRF